jgi:hypothetical protein
MTPHHSRFGCLALSLALGSCSDDAASGYTEAESPDAAPSTPEPQPIPSTSPIISGIARDPTADDGGAGRGDRIAGVTVCVVDGDCTVTGDQGRFTFEGFEAGSRVDLTFDAPDYLGTNRSAQSSMTVKPADAPLLPRRLLNDLPEGTLDSGILLVEVALIGLADIGLTPLAGLSMDLGVGTVHYLGDAGALDPELEATGELGLALIVGIDAPTVSVDVEAAFGESCQVVTDNVPLKHATVTIAAGRLSSVSVVCGADMATGTVMP